MTLLLRHHADDDLETDSETWRGWIEEHLDRFLLFARQQTRCDADAEDVLQEVLVEAWRKAGGCRPDAAHVFSLIRRRAIDLGRAADRRRVREQSVSPEEHWFEIDHGTADENELLADAVLRLRPEYGDVLTLRVWGELSFREIAEALDIPQNTAASRYRNALSELRRITKGILR